MLIVDGKEYSSFRQYFLEKNPECRDPPRTEVLRFVYHTVPEYHEKKRTVCRERYRIRKMEMFVIIKNSILTFLHVQVNKKECHVLHRIRLFFYFGISLKINSCT